MLKESCLLCTEVGEDELDRRFSTAWRADDVANISQNVWELEVTIPNDILVFAEEWVLHDDRDADKASRDDGEHPGLALFAAIRQLSLNVDIVVTSEQLVWVIAREAVDSCRCVKGDLRVSGGHADTSWWSSQRSRLQHTVVVAEKVLALWLQHASWEVKCDCSGEVKAHLLDNLDHWVERRVITRVK